ncbi:ent-kaur-16-ene synthase, chloroplastic-like [Triticum dicoccoides]|uniref:ent-kaur-16-ene synthase, chloroplastic-like n=1 Tax=Triticum dicoccoides TaxID=85692 RepID=UPI00189175A3|nr:ent-kaur-16-ene synthase, chloroplastic-like [Triticum dicoccoides]
MAPRRLTGRHTIVLPAAAVYQSGLTSRSRHQEANSSRLSLTRAAEHTSSTSLSSTNACHLAAFRGRRRPPPLHWICVRSRKISSSHAYVRQKANQGYKERKDVIRKQLNNPELSLSSYDTAWMALVPLPRSPSSPCFPGCVEWILQNQHDNGSWGIHEADSSAKKDLLLSTLACVVALKKWNIGLEHIRRGLSFIERNISIAMNKIDTPIGFDIIFPSLLSTAIGIGLELTIPQTDVDGILHLREEELKRLAGDKSCGKDAYMAYIAEGLGNQLDWNETMKFQRKNGSFFDSPSTTAASVIFNYDEKALQYLDLLVSHFGSAVPTVYPINIQFQLSLVDSLQKVGIYKQFSSEINDILDMTYSLWLQRDEKIVLDITTCAMAFRLLRMNGYDVSSDGMSHVAELSSFTSSLKGYLNDTKCILELYKASKLCLSEDDVILDNIAIWSASLLKEKLCSNEVQREPIFAEVVHALEFPFYATLERLDHRCNIENFDARSAQMQKTEYLPYGVFQDILALAVEDFTTCQSIYQDELLHLDSWVKEHGLDQLKFARQKLPYIYLSAAANICEPELSDARSSLTKNAVLTTVVDDFFDVGGSIEELGNLISLVEKWDGHNEEDFYSEEVKIVFSALYSTVNQLGAMASTLQNRDVREHMIDAWLHAMRGTMTEAVWQRSQYVPTIEEYMKNAVPSYLMGPILFPTLYFLRENLKATVVKDHEYNELYRLMSTCGRLLNDSQSFEREGSEGKLNIVHLLILHSGGSMSMEDALGVVHKSIDTCRKDLQKLVFRKGSVVPRTFKKRFWNICQTNFVYYRETDGFSSPTSLNSLVNAVINEPLKVPN